MNVYSDEPNDSARREVSLHEGDQRALHTRIITPTCNSAMTASGEAATTVLSLPPAMALYASLRPVRILQPTHRH